MGPCLYCEMRPLPVLHLKNRSATVGACFLDPDAKSRRDILGRPWTTWALTRSLFCVRSNAAITSPTKGRPPGGGGGGVGSLGTCAVSAGSCLVPGTLSDCTAGHFCIFNAAGHKISLLTFTSTSARRRRRCCRAPSCSTPPVKSDTEKTGGCLATVRCHPGRHSGGVRSQWRRRWK